MSNLILFGRAPLVFGGCDAIRLSEAEMFEIL